MGVRICRAGADDLIVGVQNQTEAEKLLPELKKEFDKFGLELNPEKTRPVECGTFAAESLLEKLRTSWSYFSDECLNNHSWEQGDYP